MRRLILTGAVFASAICVAIGTGIPAAYAQRTHPSPTPAVTQFSDNVCIPPKTQCMNDWNGNLSIGAQAVRFYHYGNSGGNNSILVTLIGTITRPGGFQPFANGSGLNADLNGRPVYQLQWWRNGKPTAVCIAGLDPNTNAFNDPCSGSGSSVWFAWSSYGALISVGASNVYYEEEGATNA